MPTECPTAPEQTYSLCWAGFSYLRPDAQAPAETLRSGLTFGAAGELQRRFDDHVASHYRAEPPLTTAEARVVVDMVEAS